MASCVVASRPISTLAAVEPCQEFFFGSRGFFALLVALPNAHFPGQLVGQEGNHTKRSHSNCATRRQIVVDSWKEDLIYFSQMAQLSQAPRSGRAKRSIPKTGGAFYPDPASNFFSPPPAAGGARDPPFSRVRREHKSGDPPSNIVL